MNTWLEMNGFRTGEEHFTAGDEHVENERSNFSHTEMGGIMLSYLPPSIRYINKLYIWTNGLQVNQVDKENNQ